MTPCSLPLPTVTEGLKLIRGQRKARNEWLVTRACSHASLSL